MTKYYSIATVENMTDCYAIKAIELDGVIRPDDKRFSFPIEGCKTIYVGYDVEKTFFDDKIKTYLSQFRTKINKNIYKVDLAYTVGVISYKCHAILVIQPITKEFISKAVETETIRQNRLLNPIELSGAERGRIIDQYGKVERTWLDYWRNSEKRLYAFFKAHPMPLKSDYIRNSFTSIFLGKIDDNSYESDLYEHYNKVKWICWKITQDAKDLSLEFNAMCPGGCKRTIEFWMHSNDGWFGSNSYIDDDFAYGIYHKLDSIGGACPNCGSFRVTFSNSVNEDAEYTCLVFGVIKGDSYDKEEQASIIYGILIRDFRYQMEMKLYKASGYYAP